MNGKRKDSRSQSDIQPSNQSERESGTAHAMKKKKMDSHESNVAICKCRMRDKKKMLYNVYMVYGKFFRMKGKRRGKNEF